MLLFIARFCTFIMVTSLAIMAWNLTMESEPEYGGYLSFAVMMMAPFATYLQATIEAHKKESEL